MRNAWSEIDHIRPSQRRWHKQAAALGAVLVLVLAGCGDGDDDSDGGTEGASAAGDAVVKADLKEFSLVLASDEVPAGSITIEAKNSGTIEHEVVIFKSDAAVDALPVIDGKVPEDDPAVTFVDEISEFAASTTASGTFDLEAGRYILICNIPAHYTQGMRAVLTVTG